MVGNGERREAVIIDVAAVYTHHHALNFGRILRHVGPHVGGKVAVVIGVEDEVGVGVADAVGVVDYKIVGIVDIVGQAADSSPEIALPLVIVIFHQIPAVDAVSVPRAHELHAHLARRCEAESDSPVGVLHTALLRYTAGILACSARGRIAYLIGGAVGLAVESGSAGDGVVACILEFIAGCKGGGVGFRGKLLAVDAQHEVGGLRGSESEIDRRGAADKAVVVGGEGEVEAIVGHVDEDIASGSSLA